MACVQEIVLPPPPAPSSGRIPNFRSKQAGKTKTSRTLQSVPFVLHPVSNFKVPFYNCTQYKNFLINLKVPFYSFTQVKDKNFPVRVQVRVQSILAILKSPCPFSSIQSIPAILSSPCPFPYVQTKPNPKPGPRPTHQAKTPLSHTHL